MDPLEKTQIEADTELESRLQAYYAAEYGSPRQASEVWQSVAAQLGAQEGKAPAQVVGSLNGAYKGDLAKSGETHDVARLAPEKAQAVPGRLRSFWSPAMAATLVLALGGLLVLLLAALHRGGISDPLPLKAASTTLPAQVQPTHEITITNPGFEDSLSGWDYGSQAFVSVTADNTTSHSGKSSATMKISDPSIGRIPMNQGIDATKLRGLRVRLSGYIKTKDAGYAGLWMRVDGPVPSGGTYPQTLSFDNMMDRPVTGTSDWQREEIVLDVPDNADTLVLGAQLIGTGQMWVDDFKLEVVGKDVTTTDILTAATPTNMGFESGQADWLPTGGFIQYYQVGIDNQVAHGGSISGHISSATAPSDKQAGLTQSIIARDYAGKRVRFSAYLKTDNVEGWAGLEMEAVSVWENFSAEDRMERRPVYGTTDWQKYEVVLDIPADSTNIMYGAHLEGRGEIWIDDAQLEVVGNDVPLTTPTALDTATNMGFENELDGWYLDSNAPRSFQIGTNPSTAYGGYQGAYIKVAATADEAMEGGVIQTISAKPYLGKRIRLTGYVNAAQVSDRSRLWLNVQTPEAKDAGYQEQYTYLVKGIGGYEGGWTQRRVEIDVPDTATTISFGVRMSGPGEVWMDDLQIEVVPDATPTP